MENDIQQYISNEQPIERSEVVDRFSDNEESEIQAHITNLIRKNKIQIDDYDMLVSSPAVKYGLYDFTHEMFVPNSDTGKELASTRWEAEKMLMKVREEGLNSRFEIVECAVELQ